MDSSKSYSVPHNLRGVSMLFSAMNDVSRRTLLDLEQYHTFLTPPPQIVISDIALSGTRATTSHNTPINMFTMVKADLLKFSSQN